ncbi:MAG: type II toxin-antitoxin system RelE family toxin [Acidobacteriota bacterium]
MTYEVRWKASTRQDLKGLGREAAGRVRTFVERKLAKDPRMGEPLQGRWRPLWRARTGDYRVLYAFSDKELWILVVRIAHRKESYR